MSFGEPQPQLNDHELRILRGMIDEYEYDRARGRLFRDVWTRGKAFLVVVGIILTMLSQIVTMFAVLNHGG